MILVNSDPLKLLTYLNSQLNAFFPDSRPVLPQLERNFDDALSRLNRCINRVRVWERDHFDYLQSSQYAAFLYFLSNSIWRKEGDLDGVCTKLFLLNKALNGIDCFFQLEMPEVFYIGHTVGAVLAKTQYGENLVLYQGCTVGRHNQSRPILEEGIVMFPGSRIIGDCLVRENSVVAPGVSLINASTPGNCYVFEGKSGRPVFKDLNKYYADEYFVRNSAR